MALPTSSNWLSNLGKRETPVLGGVSFGLALTVVRLCLPPVSLFWSIAVAKQKKFYFQLEDRHPDHKGKKLHGHALIGDASHLEIYIEDYGEFEADDGEGSVVQMELWEGELRVLVRQNINCPDPTALSMEMAKESGRREIVE